MKIKSKISLSLGAILISSGVLLSTSISSILTDKMEGTIKESLSQVMNSTSESIKFKIQSNPNNLSELVFNNESTYFMKYISLNNDCTVQVISNEDEIVADNTDSFFKDNLKNICEKSKNNNATIYISYSNDSAFGLLSYPLYVNNQKLGIINIVKEYQDIYINNLNTINVINILLILIFSLIFLIAYIVTAKIIKPITTLTNGVKKIEEGNYDFSITVNSKDEIGVLSHEFISMKDKIKNQIQSIKEEKEKVEILEKHRTEFFNNITHELKTPLTAITGYAEMIKDNIVDDEEFKIKAINRIYNEGERIHNLVLDLIEVSKGKSEIAEPKEPIYINNIITDIIEDMSFKAKKYSLTLEENLEIGLISGQPNRIRQLIINLIDNAIKYSHQNSQIDINGFVNNSNYIIKIINCSDPIPSHIYNSIFEPFVKKNSSIESNSSGLGLYLCNEIVNDNNGTIEIINGKKIAVIVTFPSLLIS